MIDDVGNVVDDDLSAAHDALRAGDAATARALLAGARATAPTGDVLEGLARASYLDLQYTEAIEQWEQAYAAHRDAGDRVGAVGVARTLACMYGTILGDLAVMNGWMARAQTLLADAVDSVESGWVALNRGMFDEDRARKEERFRDALACARRFGDDDLHFVALAYLGASLVHDDRNEEGMMLLDEALAAVAGSEVDDFLVLQEIFCQLFSACEYAHDVARADQWIRIGEAIARRRHLPAVSAFKRLVGFRPATGGASGERRHVVRARRHRTGSRQRRSVDDCRRPAVALAGGEAGVEKTGSTGGPRRTTSASRSGPAGSWSVTPATARTRSRRRGSPMRSSTPSAARRRSTTCSPDGDRSRRP